MTSRNSESLRDSDMPLDLFTKMRTLETRLTEKQRLLAPYFLANLERLPFLTVSSIARNAGVSEPTVIRFVRLLGYGGFVEFKDELQKVIVKKLAPAEKFRHVPKSNEKAARFLDTLFEREIENLREARRRLDLVQTGDIVSKIIKARKKYVLGLRNSAGCAYLLGRLLGYIMTDVVTLLEGDTRMYEDLGSIEQHDVLIAISYPRYTKNTVEAVQIAKGRGAITVSITDSELSPTAQMSDYAIIAPSDSNSYSNSYTASLSVIHALTGLIAQKNRKEADQLLHKREKALEPFDLFYKK